MTNSNDGKDIHHYTKVEQKTRKFLEFLQQNSDAPLYTLTPKEAREVLSSLQSTSVQKIPAEIENQTIPNGPNGEISIKIIRPSKDVSSKNENLPVVMYFHGGGWVLGGFDTHERLIRELANGIKAAIVFVEYSRSPEAKYPIPLEEAYMATKWIAKNGSIFNLNSSQMVVAGDSVGGNMATAVSILAKNRNGPSIIFQLLFYPVTDANFNTTSYLAYKEGYFLTRESMKWFWDNYLSNDTNRREPTISPLQASLEQLQGLPQALIIVGENDVLRDEGESYAHKLMQAGVTVTATRYLGTIHDFVMLNPIADTPAPRGAILQACSTLKKVFGNQ
jgi:acetyl esterase